MDATDEGTEQNGGGPSGAEAAKTQPQASQKQQHVQILAKRVQNANCDGRPSGHRS